MVNKKMITIPVLEHDQVSRYLEAIHYNLLAFGFWEQNDNATHFDDVLDHFKFVYVTSGGCTLLVNGVEYHLHQGDIVLYAPFVTYRAICHADDRVKFYYLHFDVDPAEKRNLLLMLLNLNDISIYRGLMSAPLVSDLQKLYRQTQQRVSGIYYNVSNLLHSTIFSALSVSAPQDLLGLASEKAATTEELVIRSCVQYIDANIHHQILVEDLCKHANVSQSYLYKCFINILGISTKDFILKHKLRRITVEMLSKNYPLKELAYSYGFSSVNHFSSVFKKYYGCSPTAYRRQHMGQAATQDSEIS
ncbi:MAG: AraC family transcriptional regulator [Angelakisella sp.]|nr:AraC family transcriptional regulator [Angelakisella sp.]